MKLLATLPFLMSFLGNGWFSSDLSKVDSLQHQCYQLLEVDPDGALAYADSSIMLAQEENYIWAEANGYYISGYVYRHKNDLNKAFYMYLRAVYLLEPQDDEQSAKLYTSILLNSGGILRQNFQYNEAVAFYDKGIEIARYWNFQSQLQKLLYNKASALQENKQYPEALSALDESLRLAESLRHYEMGLKCQNLFGLIHLDQKEFEGARDYFNAILNHPHSTTYDKARALHNMALTFKSAHADSTKLYLEKALSVKQELENPELLYRTLYELAEWDFRQERFEQMNLWGEQAMALYPKLIKHPDYFQIFYLMGKATLRLEDYGRSDELITHYHDESMIFYEQQQDIIKQLKGFQTDLIQAGFTLEWKAKIQQREFNGRMLIAGGAILLVLISLSFVGLRFIRFRNHTRKKEAYRIKKFREFMADPDMQDLLGIRPAGEDEPTSPRERDPGHP